jgi:hypothetical protein
MQSFLPRRSYDYRIREAICESGDPDLFPELNIPSSTIRSWLHRGVPDVVSSELAGGNHLELLAENRELRRRVALLGAVVGVLVALLRVDHEATEEVLDAASKEIWVYQVHLCRLDE